MGHAHTADAKIENPGTLKASNALLGMFGAFVVVGALAFFTTLSSNPERAWMSYLAGHFFFMELSLAALFFVAISWITTSMWTAPVLRIAEGFTAYIPVVLLSTVVLYFGMGHLYLWTNPEVVAADLVLSGKQSYLNVSFFRIRDLFAVVIWILFARKLVGGSLSTDHGTSYKTIYGANRKVSIAFLVFFAFSFTMTAFDQLMSLDPYWFSTMFGVNIFGGAYQTFFAMLAIVSILMKRAGYLKQVFNGNHLHDLTKFMFAMTVFWAYTGFSQYMLIWYANMPEETGYFIHRFNEGWFNYSIGLFMGKFVFPFLALLPRGNKRAESLVLVVAFWILGAQLYELFWFIQPQVYTDGMHFGFSEIGTWLGFAGLFGIMVMRFYQKNSVVLMNNPYLSESVYHHHVQ